MNWEQVMLELGWEPADAPVDYDGLCPACFGSGKAGDESYAPCPLCEGEGVDIEPLLALCELSRDALEAYIGAAGDTGAESMAVA
jgi:hypothetical protein